MTITPECEEKIKLASDAIDLFIEYIDKHGLDDATAKAKVICEILDAPTQEPRRG